MGNKMQEYRLEDCMDAIIDYRGKTPKKTNSGIPLITAKIIKNGRIQSITEYIAEDDYESWMRRGTPKPGDIVLTTEAPLGEVAQLDDRKIALAQRVITLRGKENLLDNDYLKYLLLSRYVQHQLDGRGTGTTVKGIKQSELREVILKFPDITIQKRIAHILKTLDNKIELNRQTNQTLELMAQTSFKSWFVDFDPVFDNLLANVDFKLENLACDFPAELLKNAKKRLDALQEIALQKNCDLHALLAESKNKIHSHFPNEFEFNEQLGWIPKGWKVSPLAEITTELRRGISPKYLEEGGIQVINQKCIRNHEVNFSLCRRNNPELRKVTGKKLIVGDLLINSTGVGTLGRMAQVKYLDEDTVVDSHVTPPVSG